MSNSYIQKWIKEFGLTLNDNFCDESNTWEDLTWVKSQTSLPVIIKGITHPEDAKLAVQYGADAIFVSNHGGRQLDSMPATIDLLPDIVKAVDGKVEVIVDGGFRTGIDVFKGLALGAKVVLIGRPVLYGLAYDGANGVKKVLEILKKELDNTMALTGCKTLKDIDDNCLFPKPCVCCKL
jgi:isopentenyl diphosphate isomerase/L-lactate dehydrogenase-like FMN-dependent dehydrogenase